VGVVGVRTGSALERLLESGNGPAKARVDRRWKQSGGDRNTDERAGVVGEDGQRDTAAREDGDDQADEESGATAAALHLECRPVIL